MASRKKFSLFELDGSIFDDIGVYYARIAVQTLQLTRLGAISQAGESLWTPVPMSSSDLYWWKHPDDPGAESYFAAHTAQAQQLNSEGVAPVKYEWTVDGNPDSVNEVILKIRVTQGSSVDPSYTLLSVRLVKEGDKWRAVSFTIQ